MKLLVLSLRWVNKSNTCAWDNEQVLVGKVVPALCVMTATVAMNLYVLKALPPVLDTMVDMPNGYAPIAALPSPFLTT
jgi:hypothetical protein